MRALSKCGVTRCPFPHGAKVTTKSAFLMPEHARTHVFCHHLPETPKAAWGTGFLHPSTRWDPIAGTRGRTASPDGVTGPDPGESSVGTVGDLRSRSVVWVGAEGGVILSELFCGAQVSRGMHRPEAE